MAFNKTRAYKLADKSEFKLAELFSENISSEDIEAFRTWIKSIKILKGTINLNLDNMSQESQELLIIDFLTSVHPVVVFDDNSLNLIIENKSVLCEGDDLLSVVSNALKILSNVNNPRCKIRILKYEGEALLEKETLSAITQIKSGVGAIYLNGIPIFNRNLDYSQELNNSVPVFEHIVHTVSTLKSYLKSVSLPALQLTIEELKSLINLMKEAPKCMFYWNEISVAPYNEGVKNWLATNMISTNITFNKEEHKLISGAAKNAETISSLLQRLVTRNKMMQKDQKNKSSFYKKAPGALKRKRDHDEEQEDKVVLKKSKK
jgi:hypothetical protein